MRRWIHSTEKLWSWKFYQKCFHSMKSSWSRIMVNPNHNPQSLWGFGQVVLDNINTWWCTVGWMSSDAVPISDKTTDWPTTTRWHEMANTNFTWNEDLYVHISSKNHHISFMLRIWCREKLEILHFHVGWSYFVCIFQRFCLLMKPSDTTGVDRHMAFITKAYICPKLHFYPWYYTDMDTCLVTWFRE